MRPGKYRHYKGNYYEVLGLAYHTETEGKMVLYRALYDCPDLVDEYGDDPYFVRPFEIFNDTVEVDNEQRPRFQWVSPM